MQKKIDFRGGKRSGSGRKKLGETRRISLTLPGDCWKQIDLEVSSGKKQTEVIRNLICKTKLGE